MLFRSFFDEHARFNQDNDAFSKVMAIDYGTYMVDDILTKVDRATMSVSIEAREPLIDHRIIEFVSKLPTSYKINGATQKYLLKEIVHKYVPKEMMERPKKGFGIPLAKWLNNDLKSLVSTYLNEDRIKSQGIFNHNELTKVVKEFYNGDNEAREFLWNMLMFQMWYSRWM